MASVKSNACDSVRVGRKVSVGAYTGFARYVGPIPGTEDIWVGVEWDDPNRGKHDGIHDGIRYFKTLHPNGASFVRLEKVIPNSISFITAFRSKYGQDFDDNVHQEIMALMKQSKMASFELVGMQKIQKKQACFDKLIDVSLSHHGITDAGEPDEIQDCCPNIENLELCNNCFTDWETVSEITRQLKHLTTLNLSFNTIDLPKEINPHFKECFKCLKKIILGKLNYSWHEIMTLSEAFPVLEMLEVPDNNIDRLERPSVAMENILYLNLENNSLSWQEINKLRFLPKLECLNVNRNGIKDIQIVPSSFPSLKFLMISDNDLLYFESLCELNKLPTLCSLRIQNNPLLKGMSVSNYTLQIIARIANLTMLNGTMITLKERQNNERDFLKDLDMIWHRQLKSAEERAEFLTKHPRYMELIAKYGSDYSEDLNTSNKIKTIKVRIVNFCKESNTEKDVIIKTLPITMTLNRFKDLGKRLFGLGNRQLEFSYVTKEKPDIEYPMENMNQTLDYYSVEDGNTVLIKW
ncbi:tubulin-specific chaperone E isoform X1 [Melanaphis sacchari]|uniref:tubulin-specific chaperone E isoform X1 n=1 Tax=Melanaphis sacchari TaxID=742174 RepID=UPI000DC1560F|nr:tubulin-specific chaperone E isoform X1 [Melanaphis sacchari]XP_025190550.1 tubulin-specific chaperone E isoform X1 [Melanaphis sacchari]XP_025190551.1 tubulin-specific chaperone E isoform X1 [Melanaphis sacchari]XP_025190552.1 tubulin-specific chaperone E isoform X1 [Melanaphis sacchari]XP_025190553.1 tubulin-specific chaperone E isoform X1 [Melanaphis sacchari]